MQELVISILLTVVIIMAAVLLVFVGSRKDGMTKKQRVMMIRILISAGILLALQFVSAEMFDMVDSYLFPSAGRWIRFACYLINYFIIGYDILRKAAKGIRNRQVFDESFLMAVATIGAMALAIYENGDYLEAIAVMLFYQHTDTSTDYLIANFCLSGQTFPGQCAGIEAGNSLNYIAVNRHFLARLYNDHAANPYLIRINLL